MCTCLLTTCVRDQPSLSVVLDTQREMITQSLCHEAFPEYIVVQLLKVEQEGEPLVDPVPGSVKQDDKTWHQTLSLTCQVMCFRARRRGHGFANK